MNDRVTFTVDQIPWIVHILVIAYEVGKNNAEVDLRKEIAASDEMWRIFFRGGEVDA